MFSHHMWKFLYIFKCRNKTCFIWNLFHLLLSLKIGRVVTFLSRCGTSPLCKQIVWRAGWVTFHPQTWMPWQSRYLSLLLYLFSFLSPTPELPVSMLLHQFLFMKYGGSKFNTVSSALKLQPNYSCRVWKRRLTRFRR